jgi:hypothetical protein
MAVGDVEAVGAMGAEVGEVDDVAEDRRRAGDLAAGVVAPLDAPAAGVEGVEVAVVGAHVDRGAESRGVGDGGRRVDVGAGLVGPVERAGALVVGVDAPVGVAEEDAPVDGGGGRVEGAAAEQRPFGAGQPETPPGALADRLHVAGVVAEVEHAVEQRRAGLDGAFGVIGPDGVPVACVERVDGAVFRPEVDAAVVEQRRGLAARGQLARPADVAVDRVQRDHPPRLHAGGAVEHGRIHGVAADRRRRGRFRPDRAAPQQLAVPLVDRAEHAVVGELEDAVFGEHRRQLAQRIAAHRPHAPERRPQGGGRRVVAGVVGRIPIQRPGDAFGPALGQRRVGLGHEARVRVVDRAGAVARVYITPERDAGEQQQGCEHCPAALHAAICEEGEGEAE